MEAPSATPEKPRQVGILILEEDSQSATALRQLLESEDWNVKIVADPNFLLTELRSGQWSLVVVNVIVAGIDTAAFFTLRELALVLPEDGARIRILFLVPDIAEGSVLSLLEHAHLPYLARPFSFHDFLQKVSDLLFEIRAIPAPLRQVSHEFGVVRKKKQETKRNNSMFASRSDYSYSEEEIADYERQESLATKRHKPRTNLGDPNR
jgi:DNA-binding response OmpR family regulator